MLLILNRVIADVKLSEKRQELNVLELQNFLHSIERQVQEAECSDILETLELDN